MASTNPIAVGLAKLGMALRHEAWRRGGAAGLNPTQAQVLAVVAGRGGSDGLRLSEVADALGVRPSTASESVRTLVEKGLVRKGPAAGDGRAVALTLTRAGAREAERAAAWPDFLLEGIDELEGAEQDAFARGLTKMIRALQERGRIPVARMCADCRFFRPNVHGAAARRPHHCAFVDAPFGDRELRLECDDHERAEASEAEAIWRRFTSTELA